ncbi:MAG: beta-ketoacyl synthase N-terminal-like domain-containing protein [Candidatus Riflebacteria bacterium]
MKTKNRQLARKVSVIGAGMSKFGMFPDMDSKDLFVEAFENMRKTVDKSFDPAEIDAVYVGNFSNDYFVNQSHWAPMLTDAIGLCPRPATRTEGACASGALAFREGVMAIASGMCDMVLVGGVEQMSKRTTEEVAEGLALASVPYEGKAGFTFPAVFGAVATAYFEKYGYNRKDLFHVTLKSHDNSTANPKAQINKAIREIMEERKEKALKKGTQLPDWKDEMEFLSDTRSNPPIAWPMHLFDCCPISDGAACVLLVAEEFAEKYSNKPLRVAGIGQGSGKGLHGCEDLTSFSATVHAAEQAYAMAEITAADIDFAEVHDCFSIAEVIHSEDLGFFKRGEGLKAASDGRTRLNGDMPLNVSGGLKCKGHPVGATGCSQIVELWEQLRGEAGNRQIKKNNLRFGLAHNIGGTGGTCAITILERKNA